MQTIRPVSKLTESEHLATWQEPKKQRVSVVAWLGIAVLIIGCVIAASVAVKGCL